MSPCIYTLGIMLLIVSLNSSIAQQTRRQKNGNNRVQGVSAADEKRLGLRIIKHASCRYADENRRVITFADSDSAPVLAVPGKPGCYAIQGKVEVKVPLRGPLQMYAEVRDTPSLNARPTECKGYNASSGCGGFGSCIYCTKCDEFNKRALTHIAITRNGKLLTCADAGDDVLLEAGEHDDLELEFCMPTQSEFIELNKWDREVFDELLKSDDAPHEGLFINIYIFDVDVAGVAQQQRAIIEQRQAARDRQLLADWESDERQARSKGVPFDDDKPVTGQPLQMSDEEFEQLPLNRAVHQFAQYIACHKVYGNLYYDARDVPNDFTVGTLG